MEALLNHTIGEYRVIEHLGSGGMGEVYRAVHTQIGRMAAIKLLKHSSTDPGASERFINEARIQSTLSHPNIALLYDFCEVRGCPCIIMEYVDGPTLYDLLQQEGRMSVPEALALFTKVVEAVRYLHDQGVIHRDIKPNNIKLSSRGEIKLLDFGIAKASFSANLTCAGGVIGTVQYLAPEQLHGRPATFQSDVWSLGALLYELVTGQPAFDAASWSDLYGNIIQGLYTPASTLVPGLPRSLERVLTRCLQKSPRDRYPAAGALLEELHTMPASRVEEPKNLDLTGRRFSIQTLIKAYWSIPVAVLFLLICCGAFLLPFTPTPRPGPSDLARPKPVPSDALLRPVQINVIGAPAHLYLCYSNRCTGPYETPHRFEAPMGSRVDWRLERAGYQDKKGSIHVQSTNSYTYSMCKAEELCGPE